MRSVPLQPCRRHGKKRRDEDPEVAAGGGKGKSSSPMPSSEVPSLFENMETQLQSSQVKNNYCLWNLTNSS